MPVSLGWTADRALSALLEALDEGALIFDERQLCRVAGRRVAELLGADPRHLVGQTRRSLVDLIADATSAPATVHALHDEALSHGSTVADPIELLRPHPRTLVWTSIPISDPAGIIGRVDILRDVTRERHAEQASAEMARRLEEASTTDELTGLSNMRRFEEEAQREHRRSQRAWAPYALCRVDVDDWRASTRPRVSASATSCSAASPTSSAPAAASTISWPAPPKTSSSCSSPASTAAPAARS